MKHTTQFLKSYFLLILCSAILFSCHKTVGSEHPSNPNNPQTSATADSLSDHLQFSNATKKQGTIPQGPSGNSLKISFEDTLYLVDQVKLPVKFQHLDTTQNVSGIFLQVHIGEIGGSFASYYYDVPEVQELDSSDTVSVILIGIDPTDLKVPVSFNITITPYNSNHQPIAQAERPVKIVAHNSSPSKSACGIVLPNDDTWDWVMSYKEKSDFTSTPEKIWGADGQIVGGSCCGGFSVYGICPGERQPNAHLHFNTFYQIAGEQLTFYADNTFDRRTVERGANPIPDSSDFCLPFEGLVRTFRTEVLYHGHYTISTGNVSPEIQQLGDSLSLIMTTDFSDPKNSGYGNGGGAIHYLDCRSLVLIGQDPEDRQLMYKIYEHSIFEKWFEF